MLQVNLDSLKFSFSFFGKQFLKKEKDIAGPGKLGKKIKCAFTAHFRALAETQHHL